MRCGVEVAPVRAEPDDAAEQVTQALFGEPLLVEEERDGWARVTTSYDYPGWLRVDALVEGEGSLPVDAAGSPVDVARSYLGTPYLWGGMTSGGIDCSGLVHMAYRRLGRLVPRDADQQEDAGTEVVDPEPGDLVTYGDGDRGPHRVLARRGPHPALDGTRGRDRRDRGGRAGFATGPASQARAAVITWAGSDGREEGGDRVVPAASTIKLFVASAFWRSGLDPGEQAEVEPTPWSVADRLSGPVTLGDCALLMLAFSDNAATNVLLLLLGFDAVNDEAERLGAEHTEVRRPDDGRGARERHLRARPGARARRDRRAAHPRGALGRPRFRAPAPALRARGAREDRRDLAACLPRGRAGRPAARRGRLLSASLASR